MKNQIFGVFKMKKKNVISPDNTVITGNNFKGREREERLAKIVPNHQEKEESRQREWKLTRSQGYF